MWRFVVVWTLVLAVMMTAATSLFDLFTPGSLPVLENMKIRAPVFLISAFLSGLAFWFVGQRKFRQRTEAARIVEGTNRVQRP